MIPAFLLALSFAAPPPAQVPFFEPPDPTPQPGDQAFAVEYSRNGKLLAVAHPRSRDKQTGHRVVLFDTATWKPIHTLTGATRELRTIAFSAGGGTLFGGGFDGNIYSWDTRTGKAGRTVDLGDAGMCSCLVASADGKYLVSGHHDNRVQPGKTQIQVRALPALDVVTTIEKDESFATYTLTITPDGKAVSVPVNKWKPGPNDFCGLVEYDLTTGKERKRYDAVRITAGAHPISGPVVFSPDGKRMYVGGGEAIPVNGNANVTSLHAYLWAFEYPSGKVLKTVIEDRPDYVRQVAVSPDGSKMFATCGTGPKNVVFPNGGRGQKLFGEIHGYETDTWKPLWKNETESHNHWSVRSSPGGKRVVVSDDEGIYMLDVTTGEKKGALLTTSNER